MPSSLKEAVMCAGWPSFDAGSQLPSTSNSATLREGFDMIAADPVDPQVCVGRVRDLSGMPRLVLTAFLACKDCAGSRTGRHLSTQRSPQ